MASISVGAGLELAPQQAAAASRPVKAARRLPAQKDWPLWAIVAAQIGILLGAIALWQAAADFGWIDGFFWSKPSAI